MRAFVTDLDTSSEVVVYAKLPKGFVIPTPVGSYNPDWAISFREGAVICFLLSPAAKAVHGALLPVRGLS